MPRLAVPIVAVAFGVLAIGMSLPASSAARALAPCKGAQGYAASGQRTFLWRPEWLATQRAAIAGNALQRRRLVRLADAALARAPVSVTDKPGAADSGDKRDYLSIGPYWWPDPATPTGEPYRRRDGEVNPERGSDRFDAKRLMAFSQDVELLALAWHMTGDRRYAEHAAVLLRTWFVNDLTRMNPAFDYAQAVPGVARGRPEGIIDAIRLTPVIEAIGVLGSSRALSAEDQRAIERWFAEFAAWMATSANGKAERAAKNNHGMYYDALFTHFALFARMEDAASRVASEFHERRLARQIDAAGALPAEIARTRSLHYTNFTLRAAVQMAMLGECVGVDLWRRGKAGNRLHDAVSYLATYRQRLEQWPFKDIDLADPAGRARLGEDIDTVLTMAAWGFGDPSLAPANLEPGAGPNWLAPYPSRPNQDDRE
jgi:hypothetical protein